MRLQLKWMAVLFVVALQFSFAQEKKISGTVNDESGIPLPGATVLVKETSKGTQTDFDGNYSINVEKGKTLVFSYVGMKSVEKVVGSSSTINVVLKVDAQELEGVVVVGYNTAKKTSFTGTADKVSADKVQAKSASNISKALQGESAGVQVINNSGQPGKSAEVRIRGIGSINGNNAPLYVVDGVPFSGSINSINQSDIESFTILKDASAVAIYGSRGANGVIVITTKKGKKGVSTIEIDTRVGFNMELLPRYDVISSPEEYVEIAWGSLKQQGSIEGATNPVDYANQNLFTSTGISPIYNMWNVDGDKLIDPNTGKVKQGVNRKYTPENWRDYAFHTALRKETNIKLSGGNSKTTYYTSFGYLDDEGYSLNSNFDRITTRLNLTHNVKDWLKGSANISYIKSQYQNMGNTENTGSVFLFVNGIPPIYPLFKRDDKGNKVPNELFGGYTYDYGDTPGNERGFNRGTNAIAGTIYDYAVSDKNEVIADAYLEAILTKGLKLSSRFGTQFVHMEGISRGNPFYGASVSRGGSISRDYNNYFAYVWTKMLRYEKEFGDHNFNVFVAHENTDYKHNYMGAFKTKLTNPFSNELSNAVVNQSSDSYSEGFAIESVFGQVNYDYYDRYFLSLSYRRDGSSRFKNNKWGNFGSVGASWRLSKENFLASSDMVKELKLKVSYGILGEQGGAGYYSGEDFYKISNLNDQVSLAFDTKGNPDLTWESSKMFQTGLEFNLWDRIEGSVDYYIKNTSDMFFKRRVGPSVGYAIIDVNDGGMRNSGIEFNLEGHIVKTNDLKLDLSVNGEHVKNELTAMPIDPSTGKEKIMDIAGIYGRSVGHSIYDFYIPEYAGVNINTGLSQWNMYYDDKNGNDTPDDGEGIKSLFEYQKENPTATIKQTTTEKYSDATDVYVGKSSFPTLRGAIGLNAEYKGFVLGVQLLYSFGGYGYDFQYARYMADTKVGEGNWHVDIKDRWQKPGDVTDIPRLSNKSDNNASRTSTRFLTKTDYLSLNNIKFGYNFSESVTKQIGLQKLSLWLGGDNLWLYSKRKGYNPTTSYNGESDEFGYTYSPLSSVSMGVNVQF